MRHNYKGRKLGTSSSHNQGHEEELGRRPVHERPYQDGRVARQGDPS